MELKLFLVMALISVHVNAQLQTENTTMAGFNTTDTFQQSTITENPTMSNVTENQTKSNEIDQTTGASFNTGTDQTTQQSIVAVEGTTEESTSVKYTSTTKQTSEGAFDVTTSTHVERSTISGKEVDSKTELSTENTMSGKTEISTITTGEQQQEVTTTLSTTETTTKTTDKSTSVMPEEKATTMVNEKDHGIMSTDSVEKTSTENSPEQFFNWLDNIKQKNHTDTNVTEKEENTNNDRTNNLKNSIHDHHHNEINPEKMSPKEFFEWLDSIHPDSNSTTVKNIIDTSIISTGKLIIVISTICGTFVLFVAILIAISCCRRKRNLRNDSEKSDFSMNSVISVPEKRNSQSSDIFTPDKNGFNNVFMGIPANNDVWKKLEQLSPTASAVMPESTKM
ncbi:uncharacterized protein LOC132716136 [Ruditapes philippinarum]|uniref:uncharacterized protein LOC132716136 n=1 Tax=Ruditapes philippinarum TaxID=129788 RepID=UPI00295BC349|nr:uncharacterized protein LOC132716136 [Ruditapes philippinarum]